MKFQCEFCNLVFLAVASWKQHVSMIHKDQLVAEFNNDPARFAMKILTSEANRGQRSRDTATSLKSDPSLSLR